MSLSALSQYLITIYLINRHLLLKYVAPLPYKILKPFVRMYALLMERMIATPGLKAIAALPNKFILLFGFTPKKVTDCKNCIIPCA